MLTALKEAIAADGGPFQKVSGEDCQSLSGLPLSWVREAARALLNERSKKR